MLDFHFSAHVLTGVSLPCSPHSASFQRWLWELSDKKNLFLEVGFAPHVEEMKYSLPLFLLNIVLDSVVLEKEK